jgi:hypothetical protein
VPRVTRIPSSLTKPQALTAGTRKCVTTDPHIAHRPHDSAAMQVVALGDCWGKGGRVWQRNMYDPLKKEGAENCARDRGIQSSSSP